MNWKEISLSADWTYFLYQGEVLFGKTFKSVLKFKGSGLAPVEDEHGWHIINPKGETVISGPFETAGGFYEDLCAVQDITGCFHIDEEGRAAYAERYVWCGNFQEGACTVRDQAESYFHIRKDGTRLYPQNYRYAGDFKDSLACVMLPNGRFKHINDQGQYLYEAEFHDLGIYHKGIATAKDPHGWFHIDLDGHPLYATRYAQLEPFYNGAAMGTSLEKEKIRVSMSGQATPL